MGRIAIRLLVSAAFAVSIVLAQTQITPQATHLRAEPSKVPELTGHLTDVAGGPIAGATVVATNLETGKVSITQSDIGGRFRLPLGWSVRYSLKIDHRWFLPNEVSNVYLIPKYRRIVDMTLELAVYHDGPAPIEPRLAVIGNKLQDH